MDILSGLEPQLAIPVLVVLLGALLVYVFGFQQTKEPSYEHLAVLQSSSSYKNRSLPIHSAKPRPPTAPIAKGKGQDKPLKKISTKTPDLNNKENKAPSLQLKGQVKKEVKAKPVPSKDMPEDLESGDWIQATSRKEKKKVVKKDETVVLSSSPSSKTYEEGRASPRKGTRAGSPTKPTIVFEDDQEEKTIVLKEMELFQKPTSSPDASPKTTPKPSNLHVLKENSASQPQQPKTQIKEKVKEVKDEGKISNVAFDEMADTWEEAKSRGAKKRIRTRKD